MAIDQKPLIYLNNAATSWPKPPGVLAAIEKSLSLPVFGEGFYTFEKPDWFSIKGFSGDTTVEVRFRKEVMDLTMDFSYSLFSTYREGESDITSLKKREEIVGARVKKHLYGA